VPGSAYPSPSGQSIWIPSSPPLVGSAEAPSTLPIDAIAKGDDNRACDPDEWSDSLFTILLSGPLLMLAVVAFPFRPRWIRVGSWLVALLAGWGICHYVDNLAYSWDAVPGFP
jgi:hypothetical protein